MKQMIQGKTVRENKKCNFQRKVGVLRFIKRIGKEIIIMLSSYKRYLWDDQEHDSSKYWKTVRRKIRADKKKM